MNEKITRLDAVIWSTMGVIAMGMIFLSIFPTVKLAAILITTFMFLGILLVVKYLTEDFLEESGRQITRKRLLDLTKNHKDTVIFIQPFPEMQETKKEKIFFISCLPPINNQTEV